MVKTTATVLVFLGAWTAYAAPITCQKQYAVQPNDTCATIAQKTGITVQQLMNWNPPGTCDNLNVTQVCVSPPLASTTSTTFTPILTTTTSGGSSGSPTPTGITTSFPPPTTTTTTKSTTTHTPTPTYLPKLTVAVANANNFCLFLPRSPGNKADFGRVDPDAIADSEKTAVSFCTQAGLTSGAKQLPSGFIRTANYQYNTTAGFVQVTGQIDRTKYQLQMNDFGGQYDNHGSGSPPKSMCIGYPYYVQLVEPNLDQYCIRCCAHYQDCNASRSQYGCRRVVPVLSHNV
ncbi:hypothetical protein DM01DRAFT_1340847 [Hesseltinella vesiculosa]|uniref:LysM domain-containing protein n=1 Tax=Hesseltinella vesiculosa TaxID=101127 RepID=A0A1X2G2X2_9FUNG|nr:hypothetical protein DM01DRAFT_1340847 [Hesseltinella vesiculosa]